MREGAFVNKHKYEKVLIFDEVVLNILINFISRESMVCDYKDPTWFNMKKTTTTKKFTKKLILI